jgi:hypothetical protein
MNELHCPYGGAEEVERAVALAHRSIGKCSVCGRRLSDPASVDRGMGPVCSGKTAARSVGASHESDRYYCLPLSEGLFCMRERGVVYTNIPHIVTHHSPDGFEFGYAGSGPADLALNAVEAFLRHLNWGGRKRKFQNYMGAEGELYAIALNHYQDFKSKFIAPIPRDGGKVRFDAIYDWLQPLMTAEAAERWSEDA